MRAAIPDMQKEADYFARCLLMPEPLIKSEISKYSGRDLDLFDSKCKAVCEMAKTFGVSPSVMVLRLEELGLVR